MQASLAVKLTVWPVMKNILSITTDPDSILSWYIFIKQKPKTSPSNHINESGFKT
jgi:hypothetical protein